MRLHPFPVFIGKQLTAVLDDLENVSKETLTRGKNRPQINVIGKIPKILWTIRIEIGRLLLLLREINLN